MSYTTTHMMSYNIINHGRPTHPELPSPGQTLTLHCPAVACRRVQNQPPSQGHSGPPQGHRCRCRGPGAASAFRCVAPLRLRRCLRRHPPHQPVVMAALRAARRQKASRHLDGCSVRSGLRARRRGCRCCCPESRARPRRGPSPSPGRRNRHSTCERCGRRRCSSMPRSGGSRRRSGRRTAAPGGGAAPSHRAARAGPPPHPPAAAAAPPPPLRRLLLPQRPPHRRRRRRRRRRPAARRVAARCSAGSSARTCSCGGRGSGGPGRDDGGRDRMAASAHAETCAALPTRRGGRGGGIERGAESLAAEEANQWRGAGRSETSRALAAAARLTRSA